jgi:hypothetical protein
LIDNTEGRNMGIQIGAVIGLAIGAVLIYFAHKIIGHLKEQTTSKTILALEVIAFTTIATGYVIGEILKISKSVQSGPAELGPTPKDIMMVFGALGVSLILFFGALWGIKKLGVDD